MTTVNSQPHLEAPDRTALTDSACADAFGRITRLAAMVLDVPVALVSLAGTGEQPSRGTGGPESQCAEARANPLLDVFCELAVASGRPLIIDDASIHPAVRGGAVTLDHREGAYAGIPLITAEGTALGTFCAMDSVARHWTDRDVGILEDLAAMAMTEIVLHREVAERARAEHERDTLQHSLEQERQRIGSLFEQAPAFIASMRGREHRFEMANPAYYELVGHRDIVGRPLADALPEVVEQGLIPRLDRVLETGEPFVANGVRVRLKRGPNGEQDERFVNFVYQVLVESDGSRSGIFCHGVDVTERVRANASVRESEERYRLLFDSNPHPMWVYDSETLRFLAVNNAAVAHYGYSTDEFLNMSVTDIRPGDDAESVIAQVRSDGEGEKRLPRQQHRLKDGSTIDVDVTSRPLMFDGRPCRLLLAHDVTERSRAEKALRASERRFRGLVESAHEGVWALDALGRTTYVNGRMAAMLGYAPETMLGRAYYDFIDDVTAVAVRASFARREAGIAESYESAFRRADGGEIWAMVSSSPLWDADGEFMGALALVSDITERRRAEAALIESESRLRLSLDVANMIVWERDLATGRLYNRGFPRPDGGPTHRSEVFETYEDFLAAVHVDDRPLVTSANADAVAQRSEFAAEFRLTRGDGKPRWIQATGRIITDADGRPDRMLGVSRDVTDRHTLEAQLRQALKMEAVGQLAGGVAHDFNNVLTVIQASVMFARKSLPAGSAALAEIDAIDEAAGRAAQLTRQLLAFSRKQVLKPELLDLNGVVRGVEPMLRRLIGEDIQVVTVPARQLDAVVADPGQIEQVLVNLAVNARDAMPEGGRLVIRTANVVVTPSDAARRQAVVVPGRYVRLTVADTGVGMEAALLAHAFEPFFTTKGQGRGTGLGLATVYGIVKQSGGFVWASSVPNQGTTFEIDLPALPPVEAKSAAEKPGAIAAPASGTILLVEDEAPVRTLIRRILTGQGYTVLEATGGPDALRLAETHTGPIDLVVSDMVMPEMTGRTFAERFAALHPGTRVLFMSGYTDDEIVRRGLLAPGMAFLEKPFAPDRLLAAITTILTP